MSTLGCQDVAGWVSADLDGRLAPNEAEMLAEHLAGCRTCRGRRDVLSAQRGVLRDRLRSEGVPRRVLDQAEAILLGRPAVPEPELSFIPAWWMALRKRWFYLLPLGAAAGFVALIGLLVLIWVERMR